MGVLTTVPSTMKWIPEDDLILKNAVEGGASLESLAKGAVHFSRKFTLRELQERWYSLLYDSKTSEKVSALIIELENELSMPNQLKASRTCSWKGKDSSSGKRKADSIRNHYYARRKRISSEPCTVDPGFLVPPFSVMNGSGYGYGYQSNFQNQHPDNAHRVLHQDGLGSVQVEHQDDMVGQDYENGYRENTSLQSVHTAGLDNVHQSLQSEYMGKEPPEFLEENLISLDSHPDVHEIKAIRELPTSNLCSDKLIEEKSLPSPGSSNDNTSNFVGNTNVSMQVSECEDSFHQLECPSSAAGLPLWEADPEIPAETMPMGLHFENKVLGGQDNNNIYAPGYDGSIPEANVNEEQTDAGYHDHAVTSESSLINFSTCIGFADEELFFLDAKDLDPSCLNGLSPILLSSPCDTNQDDFQQLSDPKEAKDFKATHISIDEACSGRTNDNCSQETSDHETNYIKLVSGKNAPTISPELSNTFEHSERFRVCVLNTEDPEIPNNDDVFFPAQSHFPAYCPVGESPIVKEEQAPLIQTYTVKATSSLLMNASGLVHLNDGCIAGNESFDGNFISGFSRGSGSADTGPNLPMLQTAALRSTSDAVTHNMEKHGMLDISINSCQTKTSPLHHAKLNSHCFANGCSKEMDVQVKLQKCGPYSELDAVAPESTSDKEEQVSDIDDDVPSFSDVEAMILDMDLDPDQDSCFFTTEASRYQSVNSKKAIIRLEQGARAYMNRAVLSHGAFAVLYGRHLKYFIRSPEVSLGRATEDVKVDIDLGREGRANKISRRQAIIKMDEDGSFLLKNIGKCSILVNSNEVQAKKRVNLTSGSLVEIRDLRFIFEVNQSAVRHYITTKSSQGNNSEFDWIP